MAATTPATIPSSPFFHPHVSESIVKQTVITPRGHHQRTRSVTTVADDDIHEKKSNVIGCVVNLMTCIVGSGIVGLPYAIRQAGLVAGIGLVVLTAALTGKSLRMLIETAKHVHKQSYETAAEVVFGPIGFRFILINMFIMAYGAMVTYLMITKDCASLLLGISPQETLQQELVLLVISLGIQLPLACLRDMASLEKSSGIAVLVDCAIVGLVAYSAPWMTGISDKGGFIELAKTDTIHMDSIFVGLGVLSFAFECQEAVFIVAGSLEKPTAKRWSKVTWIALSCCCCLAMVCAMSGYCGYFDITQGNILNNLDPTLKTSQVAHAMLGLTMFATYPLASFVARHVCVVLLFSGKHAHEGDDPAILNRADRRILLTTALYLLALVPATVFTDMGSVLALAGVVGGSCLAYIGPGMLYLAVHGGRFLELVNGFFFLAEGTNANRENGSNGGSNVTGESTPLMVKGDEWTVAGGESSTKHWDGPWKAIMWYLCGLPLWCSIAERGRKGVLARAQILSHQRNLSEGLRIGDVDLRGIEHLVPPLADNGNNHYLDVVDEHGGNHHHESKNNKPPPPKTIPSLEPDPQAEPPAVQDFCIALFYILWGVLALFAGLVSLSASS